MLGLITYLLILLALVVGSLRRPAIAVAAVLCLYGLKQWGQDSSAFLAEHRQITNYVVGIITLLAVISSSLKRSCVFCRIPMTARLVGALYLYALISVTWSPDSDLSLQQWGTQGPYLVTVILLAPLLLTDLHDVRKAFLWTVAAGASICTITLIFGHWGTRGLLVYGDVTETETNPLALASMAGTVLLIATLSLGKANRMPVRVFAAVCIPIMVAVILRSGSRGQFLATGVGLLAACPIAFRPKDGKSLVGLALVATLVLGAGFWASTFVNIDAERWSSTRSQEDVVGRYRNAQILLGDATSNVTTTVFGLGNSSAFHILGIYPHITGLEVLAEEGVVGAAMYCAIIFLTLRSIKRMAGLLRHRDTENNALAVLTGLFVFEFTLSCKQGSLLSSVYVFAYAIALARVYAALVEAPEALAPGQRQIPAAPVFPNLMS